MTSQKLASSQAAVRSKGTKPFFILHLQIANYEDNPSKEFLPPSVSAKDSSKDVKLKEMHFWLQIPLMVCCIVTFTTCLKFLITTTALKKFCYCLVNVAFFHEIILKQEQ